MKLQTRDFGEVEVSPEQVFTFRQAIYGFEDETQFALLQDPEMGDEFAWLQSLSMPGCCFILIRPQVALENYAPSLTREMERLLELQQGQQPESWGIAVIHSQFENSTINLKSPILLNPEKQLGGQFILEEDYLIRTPLFSGAKEDECAC